MQKQQANLMEYLKKFVYLSDNCLIKTFFTFVSEKKSDVACQSAPIFNNLSITILLID